MEEKKNTDRTVDTHDGDPVIIPLVEYRKLVIAEGKLDGLKELYAMDIDDEMFRHLTGKILGIVKEQE